MVENKKIKRAIQVKIPTNDHQVKFRLRVLGKPICMFGENVSFIFYYLVKKSYTVKESFSIYSELHFP